MTSEEDRTQQAWEDETYEKVENTTYDENMTNHDRVEKSENIEDILTDGIEVLKLGKLSFKSDRYKIDK